MVNSLMENYAIRRLQEKFIMQIAAQVLFEEGVKYMEQEMEEIDQRERIGRFHPSCTNSQIIRPEEVIKWGKIQYFLPIKHFAPTFNHFPPTFNHCAPTNNQFAPS